MNSQVTNIKSFPPITKQCALEIAERAVSRGGQFKCYSQQPKNCNTYGLKTNDPCWYVIAPWNEESNVLRSSRLIVISRVTGEVLYNGSAQDEG